MKSIIAIAATVLCALAASQAGAQTTPDRLKVAVSYADLDLSRSGGRIVLERRVALAVNRVCPARPLPSEIGKMGAFRGCQRTAWAGAERQLAAIYGGGTFAQASVRVSGPPN
jgi:UrcA family protein